MKNLRFFKKLASDIRKKAYEDLWISLIQLNFSFAEITDHLYSDLFSDCFSSDGETAQTSGIPRLRYYPAIDEWEVY